MSSESADKYSDIGERIRMLRERHGMTLEQVGNIVGVKKPTVFKWEHGDIKSMKSSRLLQLAKALHTTPGYLMGWTDDPEAPASGGGGEPSESDLSPEQLEAVNLLTQLTPSELQRVMGYVQAILESRSEPAADPH